MMIILLVVQDDIGAEGRERELRELEALQAEGNTDDRDAPQQPEDRVQQRHLQPSEQKPEDVDQKRPDAALIGDRPAERSERKLSELEALDADGDPDDGDAPQHPPEDPRQSAEDPAENEP